jgi:hypothetical protein
MRKPLQAGGDVVIEGSAAQGRARHHADEPLFWRAPLARNTPLPLGLSDTR